MIYHSSIRPATIADLDDLIRLERQGFSSDRFSRSQWHYLLTRAKASTLLLEVEGEVAAAAVVLWHMRRTSARLYSITVAPALRGRGLSRRLMAEIEEAACGRGYRYLSLEVRVDNPAAMMLYESIGYRKVSHLPAYYRDGADGLRMKKELKSVSSQGRQT